jgi:hypothetical protein
VLRVNLGGVRDEPARYREHGPGIAKRHRPHAHPRGRNDSGINRGGLIEPAEVAHPRRQTTAGCCERRGRQSWLRPSSSLRAGSLLMPRLVRLDPELLGHTMLSFAEMLGRPAVSNPETYSRRRLEEFVTTSTALLSS